MRGFTDRLNKRVQPVGLLTLLDDPRRQLLVALWTVSGAIVNAYLVVVPIAFVLGEPTFALWAAFFGAAYIIGFGVYLTSGATAVMIHIIAWSSLVGNVVATMVAGGLAWSGGFMMWGLVNTVVAVLFLPRRWAAGLSVAYGLATAALAVADPWLQASRQPPDPWFPTLILADIVIGSLLFMIPLTMQLLDQLEFEHGRATSLLLNILPGAVADRLKSEEKVVDALAGVTTLFLDIEGFTAASARLSPDEVVASLNEVFTHLDDISARHGLEKIKTIGDGYMAVAGAPEPRDDHLKAVADAALEMLTVTDSLRFGTEPLAVRIGIDTGPAVAGVIGTSKFSYDLWGDSVNTASRMESHGEPGRIHVTSAVRDGLVGTHRFSERGIIQVKSRGEMRTWYLEGSIE